MFKWVSKVFKGRDENSNPVVSLGSDDTVYMNDILDQEDDAVSGTMQVISLTEFRRAMPPEKWEVWSPRVRKIANGIISDEIKFPDVCIQKGEECFLLSFPRMSTSAASERAGDIATLIGTKIIGEQFDSGDRPALRVATVDVDAITGDDGELDMAAVELAAENGQRAAVIFDMEETSLSEPADPALPPPSPQQAPPKGELIEEEEGISLAIGDLGGDYAPGEEPGWEEFVNAQSENGDDWEKIQVGGNGNFNYQWITKDQDGKEKPLELPQADPRLSIKYRPIWQTDGEILRAYRVQLRQHSSEGKVRQNQNAYPTAQSSEHVLSTDLWKIKAVAHDMMELSEIPPLFLPIHARSLVTIPMMIGHAIHDLQKIGVSDITVEIIGGMLKGQAIQMLRSLQVGLCLQVHPDSRELMAAVSLNSSHVSVDLEMIPKEDISPKVLTKFSDMVGQRHRKPCLWGVGGRTAIPGLVEMGYTHIAGPGLVKDMPKPKGDYKLPLERLKGKAATG